MGRPVLGLSLFLVIIMVAKQESGDNEMDQKVKKYLRGEVANLERIHRVFKSVQNHLGLFLPAVVRPILDSLESSKQVLQPTLRDFSYCLYTAIGSIILFLPSVSFSDRLEVSARAAAAAAVAHALAALPPHQRYSLPLSFEELMSIYGSRPQSQVVEELEEDFYEEDFDPIKHILEHIPFEENEDEPEYFEK
ncbi:hypothetical protein REPUB_Repub07fG0162400 [Reevesia pubescens]